MIKQDIGNIGSVSSVLDEAVKSGDLALKPTAPRMRFVGFKVAGVPEDRMTADIRGRTMTNNGKTTVIGWQSGTAIIAPDDIAMDTPEKDILRRVSFSTWVMSPGRLIRLAKDKKFGGLRVNDAWGFSMPQIQPACRVRMWCPCGKDTFYTWNTTLAKAVTMAKAGKKPYEELPRLKCRACGCTLNHRKISEQRLFETAGCDFGYTDAEHPDLKGFCKAYHEEPTIGPASLFPRLWAVYDAHRLPDAWEPQDEQAAEIQRRYRLKGMAIRPLESTMASAGKPLPRSFVMEASSAMRYAWLTEAETYAVKAKGLDYRKALVYQPKAVDLTV